jgi:hypothetical protein
MLKAATVKRRFPADLVAEVPPASGHSVLGVKPGLWVPLVAFFGLNLLDVLTTWLVLARGGTEGNPFLRWIMANSGFSNMLVSMLCFKVSAGVLLVALLARFHWHKHVARITWGLVLGLLAVVVHNFFALWVSLTV